MANGALKETAVETHKLDHIVITLNQIHLPHNFIYHYHLSWNLLCELYVFSF